MTNNVFNMPLSVLHVVDKRIDNAFTETTVWGVDAETGEILAKDSIELGLFGIAEKAGFVRDMVVGLRLRGFKTLNECGEAL